MFPKSNIRAQVTLAEDLNQNANDNPEDPVARAGICTYCDDEDTNAIAALPTFLSEVLTVGLLYNVASKALPPVPTLDTLLPEYIVVESKE